MSKYLFANEQDLELIKKLIRRMIWGIIVIIIIFPFFPNFLPYHPFKDFFFITGTLLDWMITAKWFMLWGLFGATVHLIANYDEPRDRYEFKSKTFKNAFWRSTRAGVLEELAFRWILFLGSMPALYLTNWMLFGFLGSEFGIIQWFHNTVAGPLANFFTVGYLEDEILHTCWYAGAALVASNSMFRDGHRYQGFIGYVHSWFAGMLLFYIMFKHGIVAAILVHFLYNFILMGTEAMTEKIKSVRTSRN